MMLVDVVSIGEKVPECYLKTRHEPYLLNPYPQNIHNLQPTTELEQEARGRTYEGNGYSYVT